MNEKDLVKLNQVAEECNGLAFQFVQDFRGRDSYSYSEAVERLSQARGYLERLAEAITRWDLSPNRWGVIEGIAQAIGLSQPIFSVDERSILTAHEAVREIAKVVLSTGRPAAPHGDPREALDDLADRLEGFSVSDLSARLEGEFWEASLEAQIPATEELEIDEQDRTADNKTDNGKKFQSVVPENPEVLKLAKKIKAEFPKNGTRIDIAREFVGDDEKKAQGLLRQLRRFPHLL